jgi:hypothetical protein
MEEMQRVGLYLNDLNKFDGSAEWLVTEMQNNSKLQKAFEAVRFTSLIIIIQMSLLTIYSFKATSVDHKTRIE